MAVTNVKIPQDQDFAADYMLTGSGTYQVRYTVDSDDPLESPIAIYVGGVAFGGAVALPARGDSYSFNGDDDDSAYAQRYRIYRPEPKIKPTRWFVDVTFMPLQPGTLPGDSDSNPLARPAKYWIEEEPYTVLVTEDKDGNPITNSAGQEFTEPPEEEDYHMILMVEKNYATLAEIITLNQTYARAVNTDTFYGATARKCFVMSIRCSPPKEENGVTFYTATFSIKISDKQWDLKIVDQGFMHYESSSSDELVRAKDLNGEDTPEPVLLDTDGTRLAAGALGLFKTFRRRKEVAFSGMGV